jgi:predicted ATPase/DNA-binding CsgD family transcriptional regulator
LAGPSLDPLIGRDQELGALLDVMSRSRLVTLTGPGGSGKTRLASAAVASLRAAGQDAWFVDCSALDDPAIVGASIKAAIGLEGLAPGDPIEAVVASLGDADTVLVLDNLEQIVGAGSIAMRLVNAAPGLTTLATSRVPLRVRGEVEFAVHPLRLPSAPTPSAIAESPAGELFLTRARAVAPATVVDDATAANIAALLERLDGLPLAIELAAARMRSVTPGELLRRLDERGPASIDAREADDHRSLQSILDWTLGQLSPSDVETLEAVSICAGFDIAFAQALAPGIDVVDSVDALVTLGLAQRIGDVQGASRFRLLETIRATVLPRSDRPRIDALQDRFAHHVITMVTEWHDLAVTVPDRALLERFDVDADNVRRALDHLESTDPRQAVVLLSRLGPFWAAHGRVMEGYGRLQRAFEFAPEQSVELARAALGQLLLLGTCLSNEAFHALIERTIDTARVVGDKDSLIEALRYRAMLAENEGDSAAMDRVVAELGPVASGDDARDRLVRAEIAVMAAFPVGGRITDERIAATRAYVLELESANMPERLAFGRGTFANELLGRGELDESVRMGRLAVEGLRELDRRSGVAWGLAILAPALAGLGRTEEAVHAVIECVEIAMSEAPGENMATAMWAAIPVALAVGRPDLSARLWSCLDRRLVPSGQADLTDLDRLLVDGWLKQVRGSMSTVAYELAVREGADLEPVDVLRALLGELRHGDGRITPTDRLRHGELTKREVEILELVGRGLSDQQIAERLFISPKTASVHVANIKGKLSVDSRLQIALRAREMGLIEAVDPGPGRSS